MTCNRDCFNCPFDDCICDDITLEEYRDINKRDREGTAVAPSRASTQQGKRPQTKAEIAAKRRERYLRDREHFLAYQRLYYQEHKEHHNKKCAEWKAANPEKVCEHRRRWKEKRKNGTLVERLPADVCGGNDAGILRDMDDMQGHGPQKI